MIGCMSEALASRWDYEIIAHIWFHNVFNWPYVNGYTTSPAGRASLEAAWPEHFAGPPAPPHVAGHAGRAHRGVGDDHKTNGGGLPRSRAPTSGAGPAGLR